MPLLPGRQEFWNIGYPLLGILVYIMVVVTIGAILCGFFNRYRIWQLGRPMPDLGSWRQRLLRNLKLVGLDLFGQRRFLRKEWYAGIMHLCLLWGTIILFVATTLGAIESNWHKFIAEGRGFEFPTSYIREQTSFIWDLGGVLIVVGVLMAAYRRAVIRPSRLNTVADDVVVLSLVALLVFTGFAVEGLRLSATQSTSSWNEPVGYAFALLYRRMGMTTYSMQVSHFVLYWAHIGTFALILLYSALRFSKFSHILVSPINALLRSDRPLGALRPMGDIEELVGQAKPLGAKDVTDFTWKQLLDFDACTNCGRCQDQCPAWASGKPLSPRKIIQDLRTYATIRGSEILSARRRGLPLPAPSPLVADHVGREAVWACVTCGACMETCPVLVEHIDSIVDLRRYLNMMEGDVPHLGV